MRNVTLDQIVTLANRFAQAGGIDQMAPVTTSVEGDEWCITLGTVRYTGSFRSCSSSVPDRCIRARLPAHPFKLAAEVASSISTRNIRLNGDALLATNTYVLLYAPLSIELPETRDFPGLWIDWQSIELIARVLALLGDEVVLSLSDDGRHLTFLWPGAPSALIVIALPDPSLGKQWLWEAGLRIAQDDKALELGTLNWRATYSFIRKTRTGKRRPSENSLFHSPRLVFRVGETGIEVRDVAGNHVVVGQRSEQAAVGTGFETCAWYFYDLQCEQVGLWLNSAGHYAIFRTPSYTMAVVAERWN